VTKSIALTSPALLSSFTAGYSILDDTQQLHLRPLSRTPKQRRFLRPDEGPALAWVDRPTTAEEETGLIPKEVYTTMWFATGAQKVCDVTWSNMAQPVGLWVKIRSERLG
jgi:hypothetical protein